MSTWPDGGIPAGWSVSGGSKNFTYSSGSGYSSPGCLYCSIGNYQSAQLRSLGVSMPVGGRLEAWVKFSAPAGAENRRYIFAYAPGSGDGTVLKTVTGVSHDWELVGVDLPPGYWDLRVALQNAGTGTANAALYFDDYAETANVWPPLGAMPAGWSNTGSQNWALTTVVTANDAVLASVGGAGQTAVLRTPVFVVGSDTRDLAFWIKTTLAGRSAATFTAVAHGVTSGAVTLASKASAGGNDADWKTYSSGLYTSDVTLAKLVPDTWYIEFTLSAGAGAGTASVMLDNVWIAGAGAAPTETITLPLVITQQQINVTLPLSISRASTAQDIALPVVARRTAPESVTLPLRVSRLSAAITGGLDGAGTWVAATAGEWSLFATLGGVDISSRVSGACSVRIAANAARTAEFSFLPADVIAPMSLVGQRVTLAFVGAGVTQPIFSGVVDIPSIDVRSGLISCDCTDQAQEIWANTPRESIDALAGGRWHVAISGEPEDNFDYLEERIQSVGAAWALDVQQSPRVLPWAEAARTLTVRNADVIDGSLAVDLPSREQLRTRITCRLQYRYTLLRQRGITAQYRQPLEWFMPSWVFGLGVVRESRKWLLSDMINGAAKSLPGWDLQSIEIEHPRAGTTNLGTELMPYLFIISESVAPALALGFTSTYSTRWQQSVTEDYSVDLVWPGLEAQLGESVSEEIGATLDAPFDHADWGRDATVEPHIAGPGVGDAALAWQPEGSTSADRDEAMRTLLDRAWVRMWSASRSGRVRFGLPCRPDLWLDTSIALEHEKVRAHGKLIELQHTLDLASGAAVTDVVLAVGMPGNAPAAHPTWSLPAPPTDVYVPPLSAYSCEIGTFVGGDPSAPEWDPGAMVGFSTNLEGNVDGVEYYPHQLRIQAPPLAAEDRDPRTLEAATEIAVTIPTDLLEFL